MRTWERERHLGLDYVAMRFSQTPGSVPIGSLGQLGDRLREEADHAHRGRSRL
jgi:hypothetical protein